jgi:hypothetical protein
MAKRGSDVNAEIDALFQLSLAEFTAARNALAKRLKEEGRTLDAERVKALVKPPATAWAVNQLYWQDPKEIKRLLTLGERVRKAQTGQVNADLRALLDEKKQMTTALLTRASAILGEAGHAASPDAMRRVSATLESLAAWGDTDGLPQAGRLTADLDPPGFDVLTASMGGRKLAAAKVLAFRAPKPAEDPAATRARLREAVQAAEKALRATRRDAERAEAALAKANARTAALEKEKREIEARYAEAKEDAHLASSEAKKSAQAVADAERSLAKAKGALAG